MDALRFLVRLAVAACLLWLGAAAFAAAGRAQVVELSAATTTQDLWPATTMLVDASGELSAEQALASGAFRVPATPRANLGPRREAVWLRVPFELAADAPRRWVFALEYASIDRVDLYLARGGRLSPAIRLGRSLPVDQRPLPSAWPADLLELEPGHAYELLLRVETRSTMVLPLRLSTVEAHLQRESSLQVSQGAMGGATLCLLLYSLVQWSSLRDRVFLSYALALAGTGCFFLAYSGVGQQHFWPGSIWLGAHAAPLSALMGLVGACTFIDASMRVRELSPRISLALRAEAVVAALVILGNVTGLIDYRATQVMATVLGPLPMLLAVPVAWQRARAGDRVAKVILVGWLAYSVATLTMAALLRGWAPMNFWTEHAFQLGAMFEMVTWMRILALRVESLRSEAQRATLERDALHSLAHTDALTGLPNRRGLQEALQRSLGVCAENDGGAVGCLTGVFLIDLDGFKRVNDELGHEAGDELLAGVARRLQALVRASDTVARLGGDEFVVVAQLRGDADAQAVGRKLLDGFVPPMLVGNTPCRIGLTIGYALAPLDGNDPQRLLRIADAAMYQGKQAGRHCLRRGDAEQLAALPA